MRKFKIGDIVVGTKQSDIHYIITNSKLICEVKDIEGSRILLHGLRHVNGDEHRDISSYWVYCELFELYNRYEVEII